MREIHVYNIVVVQLAAYWVILHDFLSSADFFKINFFEIFFRNTIRVSNSLDPDQARCYVGPGKKLTGGKFRPVTSGLTWVQSVCKGYLQTILVGKELTKNNLS